jgi:enoyl-CoA hydratase
MSSQTPPTEPGAGTRTSAPGSKYSSRKPRRMTRACDLRLQTLRLDQRGRVLTARYASLPLNFVTSSCVRELDTLTRAVDRDNSVGAVVLTGGVDGRFLTHADPTELGAVATSPLPPLPVAVLRPVWRVTRTLLRLPGAPQAAIRLGGPLGLAGEWGYRWRRTILRMNRSSTVYIAAINGPTTGGGHEIALACDLRLVSDAPHIRLGQIEILAGLIPGGGGTQRLPRMIGTAKALEHILDGTPLTAAQALHIGLVNAIVPDDELLTRAQDSAARLARRSPTAIRAAKRATYFAASKPLGRGLDHELAGFLASGLAHAVNNTLAAFTADLHRLGDSPLSTGSADWVDGTRVDQTS